ncbi:hypothetical protein QQF64_021233 [Cirrhinus molitorella]|uniref:Uncharacterized protein n=2 Tax=Cirrhinus molitorella TaxID=172907 RepID=A0ABR3LBJ0_9TELE|nr:hypothetical protein Q8A67_016241 [Cirrhinus molitorella]
MTKRQFTSVSIGATSTLEPFTVPAVSEEDYCGYYGNFYRVEQINKHRRHFLERPAKEINLLSSKTKLSCQKKDDGWKNGVKR